MENRREIEKQVMTALIKDPGTHAKIPAGFSVDAFEDPVIREVYEILSMHFFSIGLPADVDSVGVDSVVERYEGLQKKIDSITFLTAPLNGAFTRVASGLMRRKSTEEKKAEREKLPDITLTDDGNALRFADRFKDELRFDHSAKDWLRWNGKIWKRDTLGEVYELAREVARMMYFDASNEKNTAQASALARHAARSSSDAAIRSMLSLASTDRRIATEGSKWDQGNLLNLSNGTLNLDSFEFTEHRTADFLTYHLPYEYKPGAIWTAWGKFLDRIIPDTDTRWFVQKAAGYSLTTLTDAQVFFFIHGPGKNGKSTFNDVLFLLLGEYAAKAENNLLMFRQHEAASHDIARLKNKRIAICSELVEVRKFDVVRVKELTGQDRIAARQLYRDGEEFINTAKLWVYGNGRPGITETTEAIWRRIRLIPFMQTIRQDEQRDLSEMLAEFRSELPGILNWAILGLHGFREEKLNPPLEIETASQEYRDESDTLAQFIQDRIIIDAGARVMHKELTAAYTAWCEANGERPMPGRALTRRLTEKGYRIEAGAGNSRLWRGIGILAD